MFNKTYQIANHIVTVEGQVDESQSVTREDGTVDVIINTYFSGDALPAVTRTSNGLVLSGLGVTWAYDPATGEIAEPDGGDLYCVFEQLGIAESGYEHIEQLLADLKDYAEVAAGDLVN